MALRRFRRVWLPAVLALASLGAAGADTRLADAARAGDLAGVEDLLRAGVAADTPEPDGTTALHWAAYRDDVEMAARLLAAGADVDRANAHGATPLSLACVNANPTMVGKLLEAGAEPGLLAFGEPPLLTCARTGSVEAVELLLARGADPNVGDAWKEQTAVMWAAAEDHVPVVETLIAHGADPDAAAASGETALLFAVQGGHDATMRALLAADADVTVTSPVGAPLTHVAAGGGHHTLGVELLDHGLDPNAVNKQGQSALHAVVEARRLKHQSRRTTPGPDSFAFMQRLIAGGAEVDARLVVPPSEDIFASPDEIEAEANEADEADRADESGEADEADRAKETGETEGAAGEAIEVDEEADGADETTTNETRETGETDSADGAGDAGDAAAENDETPETAEDEQTDGEADGDEAEEAQSYLGLDGGTDLVEATPFLLAARSADLDAMRLLLDHGADPLVTTRGGNTALTLASGVVFLEGGFGQFEGPPKSDVLEAARMLLELGADVNAANDQGQTALHGAVYRAADDLIRFLVRAGARTAAEDAAGRTPLRLAEEGFNQFASRIRRERSADVLRELMGETQTAAASEANAGVGR